LIGIPSTAKIIHTAKQIVNANVLLPNTAICCWPLLAMFFSPTLHLKQNKFTQCKGSGLLVLGRFGKGNQANNY
jgi:hypothetical protein